MEVIILAGGLGTRLRSVTGNKLSKAMVMIKDKPFLTYIMKYLKGQGATKIILSVGYKSDTICGYFGDKYLDIPIEYVFEDEPLGTGGAIKSALEKVNFDSVVVINGDTFFSIPLGDIYQKYKKNMADVIMMLKTMENVGRYGSVCLSGERVINFGEKKKIGSGNINGGIYIIKKNLFKDFKLPEKFSFEKDFLEPNILQLNVIAKRFDNYFIDIGVPEDYERACQELLLKI